LSHEGQSRLTGAVLLLLSEGRREHQSRWARWAHINISIQKVKVGYRKKSMVVVVVVVLLLDTATTSPTGPTCTSEDSWCLVSHIVEVHRELHIRMRRRWSL